MSVSVNQSAFVVGGAQPIGLSQMFSVTASSADPAYLVLCGLDRNEYTAAGSGAAGTLSGNGNTLAFSSIGSDERTAGIVFTYDSATGRYYNSTYGYFDQLTYNASGGLNELANLSLFGMSNYAAAAAIASVPGSLAQTSAATYFGSITVATQPHFTATAPAQATPGTIASIAASFVGDAWNMDGCWVLASTIAAEAGASLPVNSTMMGVPGTANGEWQIAFDGPAGQTGNWQSMVREGDIVVIGNDSGLAHITTCVSGSGSSAMLVDNITYINASGGIANSANDGSPNDVTVAAPHAASQEFSSALAKYAVIYRLDTPVITVAQASASLASGASLSLQSYFSAADPFGKAVTQYQVYDTSSSDSLTVSGTHVAAHSTGTAYTLSSLSSVCLLGGSAACTDTVEVRAYNGSYWGDWGSLAIQVGAASSPILAHQTANQTWYQGSRVTLQLPSTTFADPQKQALTYSAVLAGGSALPSWLSFNPTTLTFSGTVPAGMENLSVSVTATDTSGLAASETFQVTVPAAAPKLAQATPAQIWTEGSQVSFTLPAGTFSDPQSETLTYKATLSTGAALPSWLSFNTATGMFSGTVPYTPSALCLSVTATDTSGLSASESFRASLVAPPPKLAAQTANQTWIAGKPVSLSVGAGTFSAVPGQTLHYTATQVDGRALPAGVVFNTSTGSFSGAAPLATGTYTLKVTSIETSGLTASETFDMVVTASAPTVVSPTATQSWTAGKPLALSLASAFADPQGETLHYAATLADGTRLPNGLTVNASTGLLSGTIPLTQQSLAIKVTATDGSGLSASENFQATVSAAAPGLVQQTTDQLLTAGQRFSLALATGAFSDPQGETMHYTAALADGSRLPSWLALNSTSGALSGTATTTLGTTAVTLTAINGSGLSMSETFGLTVTAAAPVLATPTPDQVWTAGKSLAFALPAGTFADPQHEVLHYTTTLADGSALPPGLLFNATTGLFSGRVPLAPGALDLKVTATDVSGLTASETFKTTVAASAPSVASQTADQVWTAGKIFSFAVPRGAFTDPQGEALTYTATLANGQPLPSGILFNGISDGFYGTAPLAPQTLALKLTATDGSGLSASETFQAVISAAAPVLAVQTADQSWLPGQKVSLRLAANSFTDPQGQKLQYTATQSDGQALPSWLAFNASTETFSGTAPINAETLGITVTATDASGLATSETVTVAVAPQTPAAVRAIANQLWSDGSAMKFIIPAATFADPQGSALTYTGAEISGADQTSWLHFDPTGVDFFGTPPAGTSGTIGVQVTATDQYGLSATRAFGITFVPSTTAPGSELLAFHS